MSKILKAMGFKVSYEAVRKWYHRCKDIFNVERKRRRYITIDKTAIKAGKRSNVGVAVDVEKIGNLECLEMIMDVLEKCKNEPI